jgi:hypothetical protein
MRTILILLFVFCSSPLFSQTPQPAVTFTNRVVTITNLQGEAFKDIQLVRADAKGIVYVYPNALGGGKIHYTNLSPATLAAIGLDADAADKESKLTAEEAAHEKQLADEEREKMRDPANYKTVHLASFTTLPNMGAGVGQGTVTEFEKRGKFVIYNVPEKIVTYFAESQRQTELVSQTANQLEQVRNQRAQNQARISNLTSEKARLSNKQSLGLDIQIYSSAPSNPNWNLSMAQEIRNNADALGSAQRDASTLAMQESQLQSTLAAAKDELASFLKKHPGHDCEIRVFASQRKRYMGNSVLYCAGDKEPKRSSVSGL